MMVWFKQGTEILFRPLVILYGTEPVSGLTRELLGYIALFFFFNLVSGDLVPQNFNSQLEHKHWPPMFWSSWTQRRGPDLPTSGDLAYG